MLHPVPYVRPRVGCERPRRRRLGSGPLTVRLLDARGLTLIELLVAMAITVVVLGGVISVLVFGERLQLQGSNYADAQNRARTDLDAMVSEIRQAWNILSSGPNFVDMDVDLAGSPYQVYYQCDVPQPGTSYHECVRLQTSVGAPLPSLSTGEVVLEHLENASNPVFSWGPSPIAPYYMTARVAVPASNGGTTKMGMGSPHTIVLSDGALMRNENVQN